MRIEHVAIWAKNLEKVKQFYIQFFGGSAGEKYVNPDKNFESYFISFQSGARLEIMRLPSTMDNGSDERFLGYSHMAFSTGSVRKVNALTNLLREKGYMIVREPAMTGDGYYESCVRDPAGNKVEITK